MSVKTAVDSACIRVVGYAPTAVFASQDQLSIEMADLVSEVGHDISRAHEWQALVRIVEMNGAESFPKPVDYDRMCVGQGILNKASWFWGYFAFQSISQYLEAINGRLPMLNPGGWILLGDEFKFYPAPTGIAQFPYISNHIVRGADGVSKERFTRDDDTFRLSEQLLTLGLVWKWKEQKGLQFEGDRENYLELLAQETAYDKGARVLKPDQRYAYPTVSTAYMGRTF